MRPRTKSIVNAREYFRHESSYATTVPQDDGSDGEDNWMEIALRGKPAPGATYTNDAQGLPSHPSFPLVTKGRKRGGSSESTFSSRSTLTSWDENDPDLVDDDDDDDMGIERLRTCSHRRRISFDDDVSIVTIPSRESFDAEYKRRVWYSLEDLSRMRQED